MEKPRKPVPRINPDNAPFWAAARDHTLMLPRCADCETWFWPPGPVCPSCLSEAIRWEAASGRGTVSSWVAVHQPWFAAFADDIPYLVAQIELEEGVRITAGLVDVTAAAVSVGLPVAVVFDDVADDVTLPMFRPVR